MFRKILLLKRQFKFIGARKEAAGVTILDEMGMLLRVFFLFIYHETLQFLEK